MQNIIPERVDCDRAVEELSIADGIPADLHVAMVLVEPDDVLQDGILTRNSIEDGIRDLAGLISPVRGECLMQRAALYVPCHVTIGELRFNSIRQGSKHGMIRIQFGIDHADDLSGTGTSGLFRHPAERRGIRHLRHSNPQGAHRQTPHQADSAPGLKSVSGMEQAKPFSRML